ncbi:TIGR04282 family arsenosugar biosynthesis glycosyltransferase [Geodermatophilus sp. URMC 63]
MSGALAAQLLVLPPPGRGRSHLTPPCAPGQAAAVTAAAVADTLDAVRATPVARRVVALDGAAGDGAAGDGAAGDGTVGDGTAGDLDLSGCTVLPQADGDLGTRPAAAFADAMGPAGVGLPTLLIGTDTPQVTPALLAACLVRLLSAGRGTAVLGTTPDGGWWALGLHSACPAQVLPEVPMSGPDAAERARAALTDAGVTVLDLPELADVDRFPGALSVAEACGPGTRTARVVAEVAAVLDGGADRAGVSRGAPSPSRR